MELEIVACHYVYYRCAGGKLRQTNLIKQRGQRVSNDQTPVFQVAADGVDPQRVPRKRLNDHCHIPVVGMGTFGSDRFSAEDIAKAVLGGAEVGFRAFDCASIYGNEKEIGQSLRVIQQGGVDRSDLFVTSKLWNDAHDRVGQACRESLASLQLDYLDLYLVHWPFSNFHPIGCDGDSRSPDAKPYLHEDFMKTWRQMEALVDEGLVRAIGVSNMTVPKLELLLADARIAPVACELECHPHFQQPELVAYLQQHAIQPIGFCPIGSPTRPDRDKTDSDTVDIEDPVIQKIAKRLGVHPAVVCIKWAVQRGVVPIPFSIYREEFKTNIQCALPEVFPLTEEEMQAIAGIDRNCRLIKGQVFLWKENQSWEDLWDLDGRIAT